MCGGVMCGGGAVEEKEVCYGIHACMYSGEGGGAKGCAAIKAVRGIVKEKAAFSGAVACVCVVVAGRRTHGPDSNRRQSSAAKVDQQVAAVLQCRAAPRRNSAKAEVCPAGMSRSPAVMRTELGNARTGQPQNKRTSAEPTIQNRQSFF